MLSELTLFTIKVIAKSVIIQNIKTTVHKLRTFQLNNDISLMSNDNEEIIFFFIVKMHFQNNLLVITELPRDLIYAQSFLCLTGFFGKVCVQSSAEITAKFLVECPCFQNHHFVYHGTKTIIEEIIMFYTKKATSDSQIKYHNWLSMFYLIILWSFLRGLRGLYFSSYFITRLISYFAQHS